jgi:BTB/POZ domain
MSSSRKRISSPSRWPYDVRRHSSSRYYEASFHHKNCVSTLQSRSNDIVTLLVGSQRARVKCHKILLAYFSEFFNALCYRWSSVNDKHELELPEDDPKHIKLFVKWIYAGEIPYATGVKPEQIWVLGNKFLAPELCNMAITQLTEITVARMERRTANDALYIFENAPKGSRLRDLITMHVRLGYWNWDNCHDHCSINREPKSQFWKKWLELLKAEGPLPNPNNASGYFFVAENLIHPDDWRPGQKLNFRNGRSVEADCSYKRLLWS